VFLWENAADSRLQTVTTALRRVVCFCAALLLSAVVTLGLAFDSSAQDQPVQPKADRIQELPDGMDRQPP